MSIAAWAAFEQHIQRLFRLDATPASGAKFQAPGDAVDNRHPCEADFRFLADCKYTEHSSYSLQLRRIKDWQRRCDERGHRFLIPLRFYVKAADEAYDYAVVKLEDLHDLCERAGVLPDE